MLIPAIAWYIWKQSEAQASLQVSSTSAFQKLPRSWKEYLRHVNFALLCGAAALTIVALARPQSSDSWSQSNTEGIDIVLSLDVSNIQPTFILLTTKLIVVLLNMAMLQV